MRSQIKYKRKIWRIGGMSVFVLGLVVMVDFVVRKAVEEDVMGMARVYAYETQREDMYEGFSLEEAQELMQYYRDRQYTMYVTVMGGEVVGLTVASYYFWKGWRIFVHELFVHQDFHGQGMGAALLSQVEQHYRAVGKPFVAIDLQAHVAAPAMGFYEHVGFVATGLRHMKREM